MAENRTPQPTTTPEETATRLVAELTSLAETLEPSETPGQIAAALTTGSPHLALSDLQGVLDKLRTEGMQSLFHDEVELRQFFRVMAERTLAKMFVLTEHTLDLIQQKLQHTPLSNQTLGGLTKVLEALSKQSAATTQLMHTSAAAAEEARRRAAALSTPELAAEVARKRQLLETHRAADEA
ncbi:MAG TPA: hypothetical protein VKB63_08645 [Gemmatimonadales bacterium]|nr:hypothetical protein [Gemmatimonadales bacterium]